VSRRVEVGQAQLVREQGVHQLFMVEAHRRSDRGRRGVRLRQRLPCLTPQVVAGDGLLPRPALPLGAGKQAGRAWPSVPQGRQVVGGHFRAQG